MARTDRPTPAHLSYLARAAAEARRWEPFALLRGAEARAHGLPRLGCAKLPQEDVVEVVQDPTPGFAPSAISAIAAAPQGGRYRVVGRWLGLLGSMGPLPLHLSEYAAWEARYAAQRPFGRFLDLIARRMQHLFYRAWAEAVPAAQADRPEDDRFARYVGALSGAGDGAAVPDQEDAAFPADARLAYAALFGSRRSAVGIEDALSHLLGGRTRLLEYQPRHRELEPEDRTRLGVVFTALGRDAMLGHRVRTVTDAFRVVVHAEDAAALRALLPGGRHQALAAAALDAFAPAHLEWDIAIEVPNTVAPPARLDGRSRLGWTTWIGPAAGPALRRDPHLRRTSRSATTRRKAA